MLRTCSVLLLCVSTVLAAVVQQSEYANCGYDYKTMVATDNATIILTYTTGDLDPESNQISLLKALDICSGMDGTNSAKTDCGFVRVASDPPNTYLLYTPPSYEIRNESDPSSSGSIELSVYKKDPEGCVDFDSYSYLYADLSYTAVDKCPTNRRIEQCSYQNETSDVESDCPVDAGGLCCFDGDAASGSKCTNSYLYTCDVPSIASEIGDASISSPSSDSLASGETDKHVVYVGEKVTITCNEGLTFAYHDGWNVDSDSKTVITCALDSVTDKTTDIANTLRQGMCSESCKGVYYDATTTEMNQVFPAREATKLDVKCKDGYGLEGGYTTSTPTCVSNSWLAITNCTSCEIPTATTGTIFTPSVRVKPEGTVTTTCESGYSLLASQTTTTTCREDTNSSTGFSLATKPVECVQMCSLDLFFGGDYPHSVPSNVSHLAYGSSIELSCPGGTLPVGQSSTLTCGTAGENITPLRCDVECTTTSAVEHAYLKVDGTTADTKVPAGTVITVECRSSYGIYYGKSNTFNCSGLNYNASADAGARFQVVPECMGVCTLKIGSAVSPSLGQATVIIGTTRNVSDNSEILKGETVNIPCKQGDYFVIKSEVTSQNLTCDSGSTTNLYPDECQKPCKISDLTGGTNNTVITPNPELGIGSKVTFTCNDNYQLGNGANTRDTSLVTCSTDAVLDPSAIPVESTCYPLPSITAQGSGEMKVAVTISLPSDFDRSVIISKVVFKQADDQVLEEILTAGLTQLKTYATQDVTLDYKKYLSSATVKAYVHYEGVTSSKSVDTTSPTGPASLTADTFSVTFTGRTSFTITAPNNNAASIKAIYTTAKIRADFYLKTSKRATGSVVYSMDVSLDSLGAALSVPSGELEEGKEYQMVLTTYLSGAEGGSIEFTVETGIDAPTISEQVVTSTSNKLTITLSAGSTQDATYTIYYSVNGAAEMSESITFSGGVAVFTQTGLTAEQAYTYKVSVQSGSGPRSTAVSITFTQGPTEPTELASSDMSDSGAVVKWTSVADNTYTVTLKAVNNGNYITISTNSTSNSNFTFTDLDAGQEYEIAVAAQMIISGAQYSSADSVITFTTYDCDVNKIKANFELYSSSGSIITDAYLRKDASAVFNISCVTDYEPDVPEGGAIDNQTACTGPNQWDTYTDCKDKVAATGQENDSDVVVGVVLGILAVVIIIAIILILIYRRNQRKSSSNRYNPSAEEKKSNEKADGGEAWRNPYYVENEKGSPDIPEAEPVYDNDIADRGDNVSQEVKIEFQDNDEDGNEVHENKLADANV